MLKIYKFYYFSEKTLKTDFFDPFSTYFTLKVNAIALGYLTCLYMASGAKRDAHPWQRLITGLSYRLGSLMTTEGVGR
jgi:hypothetical protein